MSRKVEAIVNGPLNLGEEVVEIYERKVSAYGNGAKVDGPEEVHRLSSLCDNCQRLELEIIMSHSRKKYGK